MATEKQPKRIIEIVYVAYANYKELPTYYLTDEPLETNTDNIKVELTKDEVEDYRATMLSFTVWQETIRKLAFPDMEE